ncbi:hypothetical protein GIB67_015525 [Kingdonia uniflora]|uniref:Uncharacterized protein n=1 Tax=Kingdonia uniflora TaxID=39325 RepID=A0A7J7LAI5_9MAGN|nr:hypothetical protein GIB67_015525 [Kingdonia uniflora]
MVDDEVEVEIKVNLEVISSEYGGDRLEWKKGDEKDDKYDEKDGEKKAKSVEEEQPQVAEEKEVQEIKDSEQQTVVVYYDRKKDEWKKPMRSLMFTLKLDSIF